MAEEKNPGTGGSVLPQFVPHDPDAPYLRAARLRVDAGAEGAPLEPIWASIGYDELNWTYTHTGKRLLATIGEAGAVPFHVRPHNIFTSGTGFGLPHWGSGNVYHEDPDGAVSYDFSIADQSYDAIVATGHHVLVELGFTPRDLLPERAQELAITDSPTVYSAYEAGQWAYPPRDLVKWGELVAALAQHSVERYGEAEVAEWLWELWNEPDIYYWRGTHQEYLDLYEATARAVRRVLPRARVGGPAVTGGPGGEAFLSGFLDGVAERGLPLDFVSFHTKGSMFTPWRSYGPIGAPAEERQSPSTYKMLHEIRSQLRVIAHHPGFAGLPVYVDECDAAVPAHWGVYDNANFAFQNTEYYPVFQINLMKKILDLNAGEDAAVTRATTWSFYFEGERYFEGTRSFLTAGGIEKPLLNGYRMLALLGGTRLPVASDAASAVERLDRAPAPLPEEIDALAARSPDGEVTVLVYRHADDQYHVDAEGADITVTITGLSLARYTLAHRRIDRDHSNAHTVWQSMGAPQDPDADELDRLRERQGLEELEPVRVLSPEAGELVLQLRLPLPGVSALVLSPLEA